ncbi:amylosucrase [Natronospirillum operosum]|uniref:Amylosucrase n=1 Tax=Natronospirillum operosum TaxID=2759953 RepID=A0A4Z0WJ07_9GAMM|nr:alpha-amylase family glycosyl hydrolase [Natronospirillum operosum]TGG95846.1 amylosucrase [Natronospirillum operosum]
MTLPELQFPDRDVQRTLERLTPRLQARAKDAAEWSRFEPHLQEQFPRLFALLRELYGDQYDFFWHLEQVLQTVFSAWQSRTATLKRQDARRQKSPTWYQDQSMVGAAVYVDLFAGDLKQLQERIPYFQELGLTYLHLMPLFKAPEANSDGGYAVSDYRQVDPKLGTMQDLKNLAAALRKVGICMVLDFVFNHTSDEHDWARRAQQGDPDYMDYYFCFEHKSEADEYGHALREIFPEIRKGCFTWREDMQRWVWTTFNSFQWDLNYRNPAVFNAMLGELLYLANVGADILRFDALAFVWKEKGTSCENLPQAHLLIQAFNAATRMAAPGVLFKSEAIVHPDEVVRYIDRDECQLSYNPLLMAMLWNSLATRKVRLMTRSLQHRFRIPQDCAWVNYIRCHDDVGWTFDDEVAWELGINPHDHRDFLNQFYTGRFPGSFARGVAFQENQDTGDCRVAGQLASLTGLEKAIEEQDEQAIEAAIQRILMLHAIIFSIGGMPVLYIGDELALLNDYSYEQDVDKQDDSRWVNRVRIGAQELALRKQPETPHGRVYNGLQALLAKRRAFDLLGGEGETQIVETDNVHVFGFVRQSERERMLVLANFSEYPQAVSESFLTGVLSAETLTDRLTDQPAPVQDGRLELSPYQCLWLQPTL